MQEIDDVPPAQELLWPVLTLAVEFLHFVGIGDKALNGFALVVHFIACP